MSYCKLIRRRLLFERIGYFTCFFKWFKLQINLPAFEKKKKIHDLDPFRGNGPYGKIPTEKEPITTLGFTLPYNNLF